NYVSDNTVSTAIQLATGWAAVQGLPTVAAFFKAVGQLNKAHGFYNVFADHIKSQVSLIDKAMQGQLSSDELIRQSDILNDNFLLDAVQRGGAPAAAVGILKHFGYSWHEPSGLAGFANPDGSIVFSAPEAWVPRVAGAGLQYNGSDRDDGFLGGSLPDTIS